MRRGFWWVGHKERDQQENPDVGGRIILKWMLKIFTRMFGILLHVYYDIIGTV
jgi:hypothetical protein